MTKKSDRLRLDRVQSEVRSQLASGKSPDAFMARSFGKPIEAETAVPADVLAAAAVAEGSVEAAARIWAVPMRAVKRAVAFQADDVHRKAA